MLALYYLVSHKTDRSEFDRLAAEVLMMKRTGEEEIMMIMTYVIGLACAVFIVLFFLLIPTR